MRSSRPRARRSCGADAPAPALEISPPLRVAPRGAAARAASEPRLRSRLASDSLPATSPVSLVHGGAEEDPVARQRRELFCSRIALGVKLGLMAVVGVSLVRVASAYQQRMDRQGEIMAVLQIEQAKLAKARERFDELFMAEGEQRLIREQSQWIAPNRLRVVWQDGDRQGGPRKALPTVETAAAGTGSERPRP